MSAERRVFQHDVTDSRLARSTDQCYDLLHGRWREARHGRFLPVSNRCVLLTAFVSACAQIREMGSRAATLPHQSSSRRRRARIYNSCIT